MDRKRKLLEVRQIDSKKEKKPGHKSQVTSKQVRKNGREVMM
jgi:hypothetical protein